MTHCCLSAQTRAFHALTWGQRRTYASYSNTLPLKLSPPSHSFRTRLIIFLLVSHTDGSVSLISEALSPPPLTWPARSTASVLIHSILIELPLLETVPSPSGMPDLSHSLFLHSLRRMHVQ